MKISFIASHSQSKLNLKTLKKIYKMLLEYSGESVFTGNLFKLKEKKLKEDDKERENRYKKVIKEIRNSDIVVLEFSYPSSANVGHILSSSLEQGVPVVALYKIGKDPFFLKGLNNDKLILLEYTDKNLISVLKDGLEYAAQKQDTRFNFFIPPKIVNYLDWVSKNKRIPRAVYLRKLIEKDMKRREDHE